MLLFTQGESTAPVQAPLLIYNFQGPQLGAAFIPFGNITV
jgi:hypothetical protein